MSAVTVLARNIGHVIANHSPQILTGFAVAGVVSTSILAVKATPEALDLLGDAKEHKGTDLTVMEQIKAAWQPYIPAATLGGITIACIISGNSISTKRNAALMSMYSLTDTAFREYKDKVVENVGVVKEQKIRDEVAKDRIERNPMSSREVILVGKGDVLCFDTLTARYFESDVESLRKAENDINQKIINESYASQNDFYRVIGLPITKYGDELGWSTDMMLNLDFTTVMSEDNRPCISVDYRMAPIRGYTNSFL